MLSTSLVFIISFLYVSCFTAVVSNTYMRDCDVHDDTCLAHFVERFTRVIRARQPSERSPGVCMGQTGPSPMPSSVRERSTMSTGQSEGGLRGGRGGAWRDGPSSRVRSYGGAERSGRASGAPRPIRSPINRPARVTALHSCRQNATAIGLTPSCSRAPPPPIDARLQPTPRRRRVCFGFLSLRPARSLSLFVRH